MGKRHPPPNLVKIHRCYSCEELAKLYRVHVNTVRAWRDEGLSPIDDGKPILFQGATVANFLRHRRDSGKRPCLPGQIYCLPCRAPKNPALGMADYSAMTETRGNLQGLCPDCGRLINRSVGRGGIEPIKGNLEITVRAGSLRMNA